MLGFASTPVRVCHSIAAARQVCTRASRKPRSASALKRGRPMQSPVRMQLYGGGRGGPPVPIQERAISILPYLVPLLDSLTFGFDVFRRVPLAGNLILMPLYPIFQIYRGIPFLAFGVFLVLYILVVRNPDVPRFIRFNTYQALVLDIVLIFPQLLSGINLSAAIPPSVTEVLSTSVFYAMSIAIGYSVVCNVKGELPDQIPGISDSVRDQI
jgi:Chloroplast import apparatus Tic20-like